MSATDSLVNTVNTRVPEQYVTQHTCSFANQLTVSLITKRSTILNGAYKIKQALMRLSMWKGPHCLYWLFYFLVHSNVHLTGKTQNIAIIVHLGTHDERSKKTSTSFIRDIIPLICCSTAHLSLDWLRLIRARTPTKWFLMSWHHSLAICTFRWSFSWYVLVMVVHKLAIACLTMTTTTVPMNDESLLPPNAAQHNAIASWKFCMVLGHQQNSFNGCICIHYAASSYSGCIVIVASIQWKMGKTSCSIFCLLLQVCRPEKCQKINSFNTPFVRANLSHLRYSFMSIKHRR